MVDPLDGVARGAWLIATDDPHFVIVVVFVINHLIKDCAGQHFKDFKKCCGLQDESTESPAPPQPVGPAHTPQWGLVGVVVGGVVGGVVGWVVGGVVGGFVGAVVGFMKQQPQ